MIRLMTVEDIVEAKPLMYRSFAKNIKPCGMTWNDSTMVKTAELLITKGISLLHKTGDKIDAIISGIVIPSMFDEDTLLAQILIWYSEVPGGSSIKMLRAFEGKAKEKNADLCMFGTPMQIEEENKGIYKRLGYTKLESQYAKGL